MADEPSWEDIFNPNPTPREPAAPPPAPLVEPPAAPQPQPAGQYQSTQPSPPPQQAAQQYPPTQAFPAQAYPPPGAQRYPAPPQYPSAEQYTPMPVAPPSGQYPPPTPTPPAPPGQQSYPATQTYPPEQHTAPEQPTQQYPPEQQLPGERQYPPTQAFPTTAAYPPTQAYPAPAAQPDEDPFAGLFGDQQPSASQQPAEMWRPASPEPQQPAEMWRPATPQPPGPTAADPFGDLLRDPQAVVVAPKPAHDYTPDVPFPTTATARFTPREEDDPFAALFGASAAPAAAGPVAAVSSEFDVRAEQSARGSGGGRGRQGGGDGGSDGGKPRKKGRLRWLKITLPIVIVLALIGGVGAYGWINYNHQVRALLGIPLPTDYVGNGNGKEVIVTIQSGDIGENIAHTLHDKGVTLTFDAFYKLLLAEKVQPNFQPGNFRLQEHMSAAAALKALLNPDSKVTDKLLITEGTTLPKALEIISGTTGIALTDLQAASKDLASLGVPATEPSLEGWLFPATYQLDGGQSAHDVLKLLVKTMIEHLDSAGVPADKRHNVLTLASIVQREAGPNKDDFYKISRVFTNRLDQGINLESDATVAYGTGKLNTVYTTDAERADATNPYNTYANPKLPIGPIGLPGDLAIDAALHPVDGPWLFFVPVNLQTGETVFSETLDEHNAAVSQLHAWCAASPENNSYCQ